MSKAHWDLAQMDWAPTKKLGGGWIAHKSAPSAPPPPDYVGAAEKTAAGNLENLKYQTQANRPDQYTPWGNITWSQDANGKWTQNMALSPQEQQSLNNQFAIQNKQSALANTLQSQVQDTMAKGMNTPDLNSYMQGVGQVQQNFGNFDTNGLHSVDVNVPQFDKSMVQDAANAAYHSQMDLMSPTMQQEQTNLDTKLRLQGLTPGTEAYNNAMGGLLNQQAQTKTQVANNSYLTGNQVANQNYASALQGYGAKNQAIGQEYGQALSTYGANTGAQEATNAAVGQANQQALQNYQTAYQAALQNYLQPLNSMNAVLTGQQVQAPTFSDFKSAGYVGGPDYSGAASSLGQWNSGVMAQQNANASSQNAMVGTALTAGAMYF